MGGLGRTIRTPPTASAPRCWGIYRAAQRIIHVRPPTVQVAPTLTQNTHTTSNTCGPNAGAKPPANRLAHGFPDCTETHVPHRSKMAPIPAGRLERDVRRRVGEHHAGRSARPYLRGATPAAQPPPTRVPDADQHTRAAPTSPTRPDRRAGRATTVTRAGRSRATVTLRVGPPAPDTIGARPPGAVARTLIAGIRTPAAQPPPTRAGRRAVYQTSGGCRRTRAVSRLPNMGTSFPDGTTAKRPRRSKNGPIPAGRLERFVGRQRVVWRAPISMRERSDTARKYVLGRT